MSGKILFSVDQQPYLQGYLAVTMLTLYKSNLNVLGGGQPVLTGPNLITKANADAGAQAAPRRVPDDRDDAAPQERAPREDTPPDERSRRSVRCVGCWSSRSSAPWSAPW